jgi:hypothetical protein
MKSWTFVSALVVNQACSFQMLLSTWAAKYLMQLKMAHWDGMDWSQGLLSKKSRIKTMTYYAHVDQQECYLPALTCAKLIDWITSFRGKPTCDAVWGCVEVVKCHKPWMGHFLLVGWLVMTVPFITRDSVVK